jgi:Polyketide cyclase / dehydrase and lipid transport
MRIEHSLDIAAPVERVWELTIDVERWPQVTPTTMIAVQRLDDGPMRAGSTTRIRQPGLRPKDWTTTEVDAPRRFVWETRMMTMRMRATHELSSTPSGCTNHLSIELTGFGSGLFGAIARKKLLETITTENECFRRAAEGAPVG